MTTNVGTGLSIQYVPHPAQAAFHAAGDKRFRVVIKGRQSGGTLAAVVEVVQFALSHPRCNAYWVTSALSLKSKAWRSLAQVVPAKLIRRKSEVDLSIELKNGARIQIRSADSPDTQLMSETLDMVVLDEFCSYAPNIWPQYIRPMLATTGGSAIFVSSPRGMNWGYDLYNYAASGNDPAWAAFHWTSTASPYFTEAEAAQAKLEMSAREYSQEIEAQFLVDGGEILRGVDAAVRPFAKADGYNVLGADIGLTTDWCVFWACNSRGEVIALDRFRRVEWPVAKVRLISMYRTFRCSRVLLDTTGTNLGGSAIGTDLQREGVQVEPITITGPMKRGLIENLMLRLEQNAVSIPADPVVIAEFKGYQSTMLPSGLERFSAPSGRHDDTVVACALALWGIRQFYGRPVPPAPDEDDFARMIRLDIERDTARNRGDWAYFESHGDSWGDDDEHSGNEWNN